MKKEPIRKLIRDMYSDLDDVHEAWDRGKIDDRMIVEKMLNLCFYFIRFLTDYTIKSIKGD